ncbi:MAG TPA: T9SS type A sorting domain-containing protein [Candidatus Latescibacteria bacterium]|nr:T9SS type A sorting domain-containing protein [Candidatus Latescibacterota bacterium]
MTVSIDVSGWAVGQYTLYVHGKDAAGNWGATESVVLDVTEAPSTIMYVESIVFSSKVAGPNKFLYTTVKVVDGSGNPLGDVYVEMTLAWDETNDGTVDDSWNFAGDTDVDGTVKFTLLKAPSGYYIATVTNLILTDYTWDTTKGVTSASCELQDDGTVIQGVAKVAAFAGNSLGSAYPNPANPSTEIRYSVGLTGPVTLKVYNLKGQVVRTLVDEVKTSGTYTVRWDGRDDKGIEVSSGIYLYRMEAGEYSEARRMVLLR